MTEKLDAGASFPKLALHQLDGSETVLPDAIESDYAVVLFYRGHW